MPTPALLQHIGEAARGMPATPGSSPKSSDGGDRRQRTESDEPSIDADLTATAAGPSAPSARNTRTPTKPPPPTPSAPATRLRITRFYAAAHRASRRRVAPRAVRTAISRSRARHRTRKRFARLAEPMRSTHAAAASSITSAGRTSPNMVSRHGHDHHRPRFRSCSG